MRFVRGHALKGKTKQRFEEKIEMIPECGCWIWMGGRRGFYGCISVDNKTELAHRVAWTLYKGTIPNGLLVLHHCDTPLCVNPNHLFVGTQSDNIKDCVKKGRYHLNNPKLIS